MFKLLNPWMILGVGLAVTTAAGVGYLKGGQNMENKILADIALEESRSDELYDKMVLAAASEIAKIKITNKTITQEIEREIRIKPVYVDCRHSDDTKRMLDAILTGSEPAESLARSNLSAPDSAE